MPTIAQDLKALDALQAHLFAHRHATTSIMFAGETTDPTEAAGPRAEALATLEEEVHDLMCSDETGELLARLRAGGHPGRLRAPVLRGPKRLDPSQARE